MKILIIAGVLSGALMFIHEFGKYCEDVNPWRFDD